MKNKTYEIQENQLSQDFLITHYKSQILYKTKRAENYTELQLKFRNLQSEMTKLSNENLKLKFALAQLQESNERKKIELCKSNEELIKKIKDKDTTNRQIYDDNRLLNYELEKKITDNNKLYQDLMDQKNMIDKLNRDKSNVEQKLFNLNKKQQNNENDLNNLNFQINKLNNETNAQNKIILNKNNENSSLIKQKKNEKDINNNLSEQLNNKEKEIFESKQKLAIANDDLNKLENDYNNMKLEYNKNGNELSFLNNNFITEKSRKEEMENTNKTLKNDILEKEEILKKEKEDNKELNKDIDQLELDTNNLLKKLEGFKTHIFIMSDVNKNIVKELECVLMRDNKIESALERDEILENIKFENRSIVMNSRRNVNGIMNNFNDININNQRKLSYEYESNDTDRNKQSNFSMDNFYINNNSNFKKFKSSENDDNKIDNKNKEIEKHGKEIKP